MINTVISAISMALEQEFGEKYCKYAEAVEQDLQEPCFLITCLNPARKPYPGKRYYWENQFCIQYFPKMENSYLECNAVSERLYVCMEYIQAFDGRIRGTQMRSEISDGILNFFVNYDFFTHSSDECFAMEEYSTNTAVKRR